MHFFDFSALFYPRIVRNVSPVLSEAPGVFFMEAAFRQNQSTKRI
jgi:hypothetical protein